MKRVKEICLSKGITIADLANKMEIHPQSLSRILSTGNTRRSTLEKMAEVLEVSISELYGDPEEKNALTLMDESEWSVLKIITLNVPTPFGAQDVAYFMYKRPFTTNYKIKENLEATNFLEDYPRQKDYPQDEIDVLILKAIHDKYPFSRLQNKLLMFNLDRDTVNIMMDPPSEEGQITLLPFVAPDIMKRNPAVKYYGYEVRFNLYMSFPHKTYQKYFTISFNADLQNVIDSQYKTIQPL